MFDVRQPPDPVLHGMPPLGNGLTEWDILADVPEGLCHGLREGEFVDEVPVILQTVSPAFPAWLPVNFVAEVEDPGPVEGIGLQTLVDVCGGVVQVDEVLCAGGCWVA